MHRHGYQGRKFGRERDQRRALLKGLAESLILNESIETTLPKAKEVVSYTEKLVTKAKKGGLHNRRQIISSLSTIEAADKLFNDIAPILVDRSSGFFRIKKAGFRRGDNAELATVSFVDDLSAKTKTKVEAKPEKTAAKKTVAKSAKKPVTKPAKEAK